MIESEHHPNGEMIMNHFPRLIAALEDTDLINALLNELADRNIIEPVAEPIDDPDCSPFDYAEVTGLWDEMYPEPEEMVDENGNVWYVS
jgi:hypothetical protein